MSTVNENEVLDSQVEKGGVKLTFSLHGTRFGVNIGDVREIISMREIIPIPRTPDFIRGVMEVRTEIIPVLDLRLLLEVEIPPDLKDERIIVMNTGGRETGIVVDQVHEVLLVPEDKVSPPPDFGDSVDTAFVVGMGKTESGVITLLDLERVLNADQASAFAAMTKTLADSKQ